ncbi:MAG: acyl-CoA dehydrogenase, partial [Microbacteriaceae bacterium]
MVIKSDKKFSSSDAQRKKKTLALLSGGVVIALGTSLTLASWSDSEWVWGGLNGNANVGTSTFEVKQNTTLTTDPLAWTDKETNPGDPLLFSAGSLVMTPGDKIFAPVALQTTSTSIAGTAKLQAAVAAAAPITQNDTGGLLWAAIDQRVVTQNVPFTCDATAFTTLTP